MRPPLWVFSILCIVLFSILGIAESPGLTTDINIITLFSLTTVLPPPVVLTSSTKLTGFTTDENNAEYYLTAALVVIYTSYPTDGGKPIELTTTDLATFSTEGTYTVLFPTITTTTRSVPIPSVPIFTSITRAASSSTTVNIGIGSVISHISSPITTSKSSITSGSSKTLSSLTTSSTAMPTPTNIADHKSLSIVAIIVPAIIGSIVAIAGIGLIIWFLRRRSLKKKQKTSDPIELPDRVFDGQISCKNTGNRVTCVGVHGPNDRNSFMDSLGLTSKKLWPTWPTWPFGEKVMGTASIKDAIMNVALPVSSAPSRPLRSYGETSYYVTSPQLAELAELAGDSVSSYNQRSSVQRSASGHDSSVVVPPIPAKSPDRDLSLYGNDGTRSSGTSPSTLMTAWTQGDEKKPLIAAVPGSSLGLATTPPVTTWNEPGSSFSTPSSKSSLPDKRFSNTASSAAQDVPTKWVEPAFTPRVGNRDRSFNAIAPTPSEADMLRTIAERDNCLALLEGRKVVHQTADISTIYGQNTVEERRGYEGTTETARGRSDDRRKQIAARFPYVDAPLPGTVSEATHEVSYMHTADGATIQRVDKGNGQGGWL